MPAKLVASVLSAVIIVTVNSSCSTTSSVAREYRENRSKDGVQTVSAEQTTVVFLLDGLSVRALQNGLSANTVSNVERFFHVRSLHDTQPLLSADGARRPALEGKYFRIGRASFPSLTYPNLVSILTGLPVGNHKISGNHIFDSNGQELNFEDFRSWGTLNQMVDKQTVFHSLTDRKLASVSFSYPFSYDTTAHLGLSLSAGLDYAQKEYDQIDLETIHSLESLFDRSPPSQWPRFIFVHLIGVDAYAHLYGPNDPRVQTYLQHLDGSLQGTFERIIAGEATGHKISAVLTADHGFVSTVHKVEIDEIIKRVDPKMKLLKDNRIASIYLDRPVRINAAGFAQALLEVPHLEWTALKNGDSIELRRRDGQHARIELHPAKCASSSLSARFVWTNSSRSSELQLSSYFCPEDFDKAASPTNLNFMVSSLMEYFDSPKSPDLLLIADDTSDFVGGYKGNHGGLTAEEMLVPVLTHDFDLGEGTQATWRLLLPLKNAQ